MARATASRSDPVRNGIGWIMLVGAGLLGNTGVSHALDPSRALTQYAHAAWRVQSGELPAHAQYIAQSRDGYLWLASTNGLLKFDGIKATRYPLAKGTGLGNSSITGVWSTRDGSVWVSIEGALFRVRDDVVTPIQTDTPGWIGDIAETADGTIWVGRGADAPPAHRLCKAEDDRLRCVDETRADKALLNSQIISIVDDRAGGLWLGHGDTVQHWSPQTSAVYAPAAMKGAAGAVSTILARRKDGTLWVGMSATGREGGLQQLTEGGFRPLVVPGLDSSTVGVSALTVDEADALWVGTNNQGLIRIQGDRVERFGTRDGLSGEYVSAFLEDREGSMWVVTSKGLDQFRDLQVTTFSTREGLNSDEVNSVLATRDGAVWIGTSEGLNVLRNGVMASIRRREGLPGDTVTSMYEDHAGRVWVGVDSTMSIFDGSLRRPVQDNDGKPLGFVVGMTEDAAHEMWMELGGFGERQLLHLADMKVRERFLASQLPITRKIVGDPERGIWLGTLSGEIARFRDGKLERMPIPGVPAASEGSFSNRIHQIGLSPEGTVLAAAVFGFVESRAGKQQVMTMRNGLPCDGVMGFVFDAIGNLWLLQPCGIVRVLAGDLREWRKNPAHRVSARHFDASSGAAIATIAPPFNAAARAADGRLWFATGTALQMVDPARVSRKAVKPPVVVEAVMVDGKSYPLSSRLTLPPLTRDIQIDYTALSFMLPRQVRFRYKLDAYDAGWQDPGTRRQAFYSDLSPGTYRFHVTACNVEDVCNEEGAHISLTLLPAMYQTAWFWVACVVAAASAMWMLVSWRLRQITTRLRARLEERLGERERIARELHDTFLQSVQGLMLKFQTATERIPRAEPARKLMEEALDRADVVLAEGRERVADLRLANGPGRDLASALEALRRSCAQDTDIDICLSVTGNRRSVHAVIAEEIERIVREAVINAIRHSQARRIDIELLYERRGVVVRIVDDGCGFDTQALQAAASSGHWGLTGMRERANRIDATFDVSSGPDAGTVVRIKVPASAYQMRSTAGRVDSLWRRLRLQ